MWKFDKDYHNLEQVKPFYKEFKKLYNSIEGTAYNSLFDGKIAGIAGDDEHTAIYLLQQIRHNEQRQTNIDNLIKDGYKVVSPEKDSVEKYESVARVGGGDSNHSVNLYEKARVILTERGLFIIPKGNRTRGIHIWSDESVVLAR